MTESAVQRALGFFKRQKNAYKVNIVRNFIQNFSIGLTQQYQSIYMSQLGATPLEVGYATGVGGIASTLVTLPTGWLADRYGIKRVLLVAMPVMAMGYLVFGLAQGWQITMIALFLTSLSWDMAMTVCPMICGNSLASAERATGMQLCDTLAAIPRIVAPVVAAFIISRFGGISVEGIRPLYWLEAAGLLIAALVIYKWFKDPVAVRAERRSLSEGIRRILSEGVTVKRWILYQMTSMLTMYMAFYVPLYAREVKNADQYTLGAMDTAFYVVVVLCSVPGGILADRIGKKRLIMLVTPLYSAAMLLLVRADSSPLLILAGLMSGFNFVAGVTQGAISVELVPRDLLGSWFGLNGLFRGLVSMASPVLGGVIWNSLGPQYVFYFLAATQILKLGILATVPEPGRG
ncbi:MAG TPA: MFS transporter [Candidatus Desulfaltia sp.]|nr:MFS transporter [Candidatus Desulfaltia sp.]